MHNFEFLIPIVLFGVIGWIVYIVADNRRRGSQLKALTDFHAKVLDKMGSTKDFGEFLDTDGGRRFMSTLIVEGPGAKTRIVRSTENGLICLCVGLGVLLLAWSFPDMRDGLTIIGTVITACGIGFLLSCAASYQLSKTLGLLDPDDGRKRS